MNNLLATWFMIFGHCSWRFLLGLAWTRMHTRRTARRASERKWSLHIVEWECYYWPTFLYCFLLHFTPYLLRCIVSGICFHAVCCMNISTLFFYFSENLNEESTHRHIRFTYCNSINIFMIILLALTYNPFAEFLSSLSNTTTSLSSCCFWFLF